MPLIKLQDNVPSVYTEESRDFQLLCRAYDSVVNAIKFDSDCITNIISTKKCDPKFLALLQTKLGFFTKQHITDEDLRYILCAFPEILKNKGSVKAIKQTLNVFLKVNHIKTGMYLSIINKSTDYINEPYLLQVGIESKFRDITILNEIFSHILPTGYKIHFFFYINPSATSNFVYGQQAHMTEVADTVNSLIRSPNSVLGQYTFYDTITSQLITSQDVNFSCNNIEYKKIRTAGQGNTLNIYYTTQDNSETNVYTNVFDDSYTLNPGIPAIALPHIPCVRGSLRITVGNNTIRDDGEGGLLGDVLQGQIDYDTGIIEYTLKEPNTTDNINVSYKYGGWINQAYKNVYFNIHSEDIYQNVSTDFYTWITDNTQSLMNTYGGTVFMTEVAGPVLGYYYNNNFYQEEAHTNAIIPVAGGSLIYMDIPSGITYIYNTFTQTFDVYEDS